MRCSWLVADWFVLCWLVGVIVGLDLFCLVTRDYIGLVHWFGECGFGGYGFCWFGLIGCCLRIGLWVVVCCVVFRVLLCLVARLWLILLLFQH